MKIILRRFWDKVFKIKLGFDQDFARRMTVGILLILGHMRGWWRWRVKGVPYTPRQLFWISGASIWCSSMRDEALKSIVLTYPHSPPRFKICDGHRDTYMFFPDFPYLPWWLPTKDDHMKLFIIIYPTVLFGLQPLTWFLIGGLNHMTKKTKRLNGQREPWIWRKITE